MAVRQLEQGRAEVENQYVRAVRRSGNEGAQAAIRDVFRVATRVWRGIGPIPMSGLVLADAYADFDAERRFGVESMTAQEHPACIAGDILRGTRLPTDCTAYGVDCTPRRPLGAPMVSSEGTCAAFHAAGRRRAPTPARAGQTRADERSAEVGA
jgi:hydrogenase expression/formation protein HypD